MSVIVTNAKNRIAYNIARSLGQKGIHVFSSDFVSPAMTFASRYSRGHFLYPSPFREQEAFIDCLIENIVKLKAEVLIPAFEETFLIAKYKDKLSKHVKLVIPDYSQILTAHNKNKWEPIARKMGIPTPMNFPAIKLQNESHLVKELRFPVFVKPKQGGGGWGITQVNSAAELNKLLDFPTYSGCSWDRFFIQEKINGANYCVAMLFRQGEYRAKVTYKQLRNYPINTGQATYRISIRNKSAEDLFQKLLENLNWHGICQADFIVCKNSQRPYLIDVNPRFWGSVAQGIASGVDFPFLIYKIAVDGDIDSIRFFREGVKSRWIGGDLRAFFPLFNHSNTKKDFIKNFFYQRDKNILLDDFCIRDPIPLLVWYIDVFRKILINRSMSPSAHDSLDGIWE